MKEIFAAHLRGADRLRAPEGVPTGIATFDRFLFWNGLPKGALAFFHGSLGTGATSLWLEAAARTLEQGRWVAWVGSDVPLVPMSLYQRGANLNRFVCVETRLGDADSGNGNKLFWLLQELMSSTLFELIGCDLGRLRLKEHQLRKLQAQARGAHVALVFLSGSKWVPRGSPATAFALIVGFEKRRIVVERALHRPTPHRFARSVTYARFTVPTGDRLGLGQSSSAHDEHAEHEPHSLFEASRAAE